MSRIYVKNLPRLKLTDLLRRRKTTLKSLLDEFGITTYEGLLARCERMGVAPPTMEQFMATSPPVVNSPPEGVLVLEAPRVIRESDGKAFNPDVEPLPTIEVIVVTEPGQAERLLAEPLEALDGLTKKARKKKESQSGTINE